MPRMYPELLTTREGNPCCKDHEESLEIDTFPGVSIPWSPAVVTGTVLQPLRHYLYAKASTRLWAVQSSLFDHRIKVLTRFCQTKTFSGLNALALSCGVFIL